MSVLCHIAQAARRFAREEDGTALVELALMLPLFLLLFFGLVDFGRMGAEYVMADKAVQIASRVAAVRPAACAGLLPTNRRGTVPPNTTPPRFGTACSAGGGTICVAQSAACTGLTGDPLVVNEIWAAISPLMPAGATTANLSFRYDFDPALNFLGGPYVPVVTVEIQNLNFQFVTPLAGLAALATGGTGTGPAGTLPFPVMSMSLPGEDLDLGENG
ncbi:TadE/TadG family type IV pilus assembly protein [Defluviimonas sp. SAOS-178_SWC]|uniref:TadE/TadG family type IV pilus assembly protein n=1 Tax=Defluviimonas sp. SAOS-178_SWC TaxID=3121287 RepID=UPI003221E054